MAHLESIKSLNLRYGKKSKIATNLVSGVTESFDLKLRNQPNNLAKAISDSIGYLGATYSHYFDLGLPADVALLYIDICDFSSRFSSLSGEQIGDFFDHYYDLVIPIIYKHGGEIDKIMGDGIICTFGPPFYDAILLSCIQSANSCAKEILEATENTKFISKIALHAGTVNYFKNKTGLYHEYTLIGKPLTELFRLESISIDQSINFFEKTAIDSHHEFSRTLQTILDSNNVKPEIGEWRYQKQPVPTLKGVNYKQYYSLKKFK